MSGITEQRYSLAEYLKLEETADYKSQFDLYRHWIHCGDMCRVLRMHRMLSSFCVRIAALGSSAC
ncbi:MAG: hypothetical protein ACYTGL_20330 [Planctomycetota bacterium]|jgi:hypothetical protein